MPSEFALIDRYFKRPTRHTVLGAGDDGALVRSSPGTELVVSTDMLVEGTHFLADTDPADLGWKVLAVNVSDMAAMGATPRWAVLAAALPAADEAWIAAFADGFFACAREFGVDLIGGDTTRGPRNFCVTIFGEVPAGQALLRSAAQAGDDIWVSGRPGMAALGLAHLQGRTVLPPAAVAQCVAALQRPQPRVALGRALVGIARSAIDVSDGLLADLGHILEESRLTAVVQEDALPGAAAATGAEGGLVRDCLLAGGDDYELVFTAPPSARAGIDALSASLGLVLTRIGSVVTGEGGAALVDAGGRPRPVPRRGYDHFG